MTDPVDEYLKTPRGKEALAYHLGKRAEADLAAVRAAHGVAQ